MYVNTHTYTHTHTGVYRYCVIIHTRTHTITMYNNNSTRTSVPMAASATAHGRPCCAHSALPSRLQPTFSLPRGYSRYTCILYYIYIYLYIYIYILWTSETVSTAKNNTIAIVLNGTERCGFFINFLFFFLLLLLFATQFLQRVWFLPRLFHASDDGPTAYRLQFTIQRCKNTY